MKNIIQTIVVLFFIAVHVSCDKENEKEDTDNIVVEEKKFTVTIVLDNGSQDVKTEITSGSKLNEPSKPVKNGYTFAGWQTDVGNIFDFSSPIVKNTVIRAAWIMEWKITENKKGFSIDGHNNPKGDLVVPSSIDGKNVYSISANAFKGNKEITGIEIPYSIAGIGASAFENCINLKKVTFSGFGLEDINSSSFRSCSSLVSIVLPKTVKRIYTSAFANCVNLESIILSENLVSIGKGAFTNCSNLHNITITRTDDLTTLESAVFTKTPIGGLKSSFKSKINVPSLLESRYKSDTQWSNQISKSYWSIY